MGDRREKRTAELSLCEEDVRNLVFASKPEAFRRLQHLLVHLKAGLEGCQVQFLFDTAHPRLVRVVVTEAETREWDTDDRILHSRRFSLERRHVARLVLPLEVDDERDLVRCRCVEGDKETVWKFVHPDMVVGLVEEAKIFWRHRGIA